MTFILEFCFFVGEGLSVVTVPSDFYFIVISHLEGGKLDDYLLGHLE